MNIYTTSYALILATTINYISIVLMLLMKYYLGIYVILLKCLYGIV